MGGDITGCVYLYPAEREGLDVSVQSWVRASHAPLDGPLVETLVDWITEDWTWERLDRYGR